MDISLEFKKSIKSESDIWYANLQKLGSGVNGSAFLVNCTSGENKGVPFVIKIFQQISDEKRLEKFNNERDFLMKVSHPCILKSFDHGIYMQHPFIVTEYMPNNLRDVIQNKSVKISQKLSYALQLLSALIYLENLKPAIIHRDIKPENIFVKSGTCVLGDFGLLKRIEDNSNDANDVIKTTMPHDYRTPDLVSYVKNGDSLTVKTDIFQLGLVLSELFTGRNPLKPCKLKTDAIELERIHLDGSQLLSGIAALLNRMLETDPKKRESAQVFFDAWSGVFNNAAESFSRIDGNVL